MYLNSFFFFFFLYHQLGTGLEAYAGGVPEGFENFDDELEALMKTNTRTGLTAEEAQARLEKFGFNGKSCWILLSPNRQSA